MIFKYSIIVTTIDKYNEITKLLRSIEQSIIFSKTLVEVIFIKQFDKINDNSITYPKSEFIKYNFIFSDQISLSSARNIAILNSSGEWLIIIDDDAYIDKSFFNSLDELINKRTDIKVFCGIILDNITKVPIVPNFDYNTKVLKKENYRNFMGSAHIVHKSIFMKIGSYNENLGSGAKFYSGEETELFIRILLSNETILYTDKLIFYHPSVLNQSDKKKLNYLVGQGAVSRYLIKYNKCSFFYLKFLFIKPLLGYLFYAIFKTQNNSDGFKFNILKFHSLLKGFLLKN